MATLKEAVESGRRWRHKNWRGGYVMVGRCRVWSDGEKQRNPVIDINEALSSDFEIEPEPEKPNAWRILVCMCGHPYGEFGYEHFKDSESSHLLRCGSGSPTPTRVHDADACDRLHAQDHRCKLRTDEYHFERVIESFRRWQSDRQGAAVQFAFVNPSGQLEIAREL